MLMIINKYMGGKTTTTKNQFGEIMCTKHTTIPRIIKRRVYMYIKKIDSYMQKCRNKNACKYNNKININNAFSK